MVGRGRGEVRDAIAITAPGGAVAKLWRNESAYMNIQRCAARVCDKMDKDLDDKKVRMEY